MTQDEIVAELRHLAGLYRYSLGPKLTRIANIVEDWHVDEPPEPHVGDEFISDKIFPKGVTKEGNHIIFEFKGREKP